MNVKLRWISENLDRHADTCGYWRSVEGRFSISPNYRSTVYPDSYTVRDKMNNAERSHDTVRDCKAWATDCVAVELERDGLMK